MSNGGFRRHPRQAARRPEGALPVSPTHLLYLHGFRSSPQSFKAQRLQAWLAAHRPDVHWWCPQLPPSPRAAMALVRQGIADWPRDALGGARQLARRLLRHGGGQATGWPAVLLNPAVDPARDLAAYIGELTAFHAPEEHFFFRAEYIDELRAAGGARRSRHPERYLRRHRQGRRGAGLARDDARATPARSMRLLEGGDHALSDFDDHLPHILSFLQLCG